MSLMSYIFCFKVSTATLATSTEIESVKYGLLLMKILYSESYIFRNQTALSRISWLTHNDRF
jgi:hypothetical protein